MATLAIALPRRSTSLQYIRFISGSWRVATVADSTSAQRRKGLPSCAEVAELLACSAGVLGRDQAHLDLFSLQKLDRGPIVNDSKCIAASRGFRVLWSI